MVAMVLGGRIVARTCFLGPRLVPSGQGKAADLKSRSATPLVCCHDYFFAAAYIAKGGAYIDFDVCATPWLEVPLREHSLALSFRARILGEEPP